MEIGHFLFVNMNILWGILREGIFPSGECFVGVELPRGYFYDGEVLWVGFFRRTISDERCSPQRPPFIYATRDMSSQLYALVPLALRGKEKCDSNS